MIRRNVSSLLLCLVVGAMMANAQLDLTSQPNPMNPPCSVCGAGMMVGDADAIWEPPAGFAPVACGVLEIAGLSGFIDPGSCGFLAGLGVTAACSCTAGEATLPPVTAAPVTAAPVTAAPVTTAPVPAAPVTPAPVTPAPVTPAPVTPAPVTPAPVTPAPVTPAPIEGTAAPVTPAPVTPAPVTAAPVTPAPVTTAPVTTAPVTLSPNGSPGFPSCPVCGEGRTVTDRDAVFSAPGRPDTDCGTLQDGGLLGFIDPANCGFLQDPAIGGPLTAPCGCAPGIPVVGGEGVPAPMTDAPVTPAPVTPSPESSPVTSSPVTSSPTPAPIDPNSPPTQVINLSVGEILSANGSVSIMAEIIRLAGFEQAFRTQGPLTIFVPPDIVFGSFDPAGVDPSFLQYFVLEHTVAGSFLVPNIPPILTNLNGNILFTQGNIVNGVTTITQPNIVGTNGVIQGVNGILQNFNPSLFVVQQTPSPTVTPMLTPQLTPQVSTPSPTQGKGMGMGMDSGGMGMMGMRIRRDRRGLRF